MEDLTQAWRPYRSIGAFYMLGVFEEQMSRQAAEARPMRALPTGVSASAAAKPQPSGSGQNSKRTIKEADATAFYPPPHRIKAEVAAPFPVRGARAMPTLETGQALPIVLSSSLKAAKQYLIKVDARFEVMFKQFPCPPFEWRETFGPFRYVLCRHWSASSLT
jgi:hypothetical protein